MAIVNQKFSITSNSNDVIDLTSKIENIVKFSEANDGVILVHTTDINSSIILSDDKEKSLLSFMDDLIPAKDNSYPFLKSTFLGRNLQLSIINKILQISDYQKIVLINFDYKTTIQDIIVSLIY